MTDHDTTIREAREYRDALTSGDVITVQIKSTAKPLVPVDPDKLSGMLDRLLAVIEQQQATIERFEASNRYGDQMIFAQSDVIGELNNDVSDLRATIDQQAEKLRQVRELAEDVKGCPEKYGYEKSGWDAAMDQVLIRLDFPDASRILDAGGEG